MFVHIYMFVHIQGQALIWSHMEPSPTIKGRKKADQSDLMFERHPLARVAPSSCSTALASVSWLGAYAAGHVERNADFTLGRLLWTSGARVVGGPGCPALRKWFVSAKTQTDAPVSIGRDSAIWIAPDPSPQCLNRENRRCDPPLAER